MKETFNNKSSGSILSFISNVFYSTIAFFIVCGIFLACLAVYIIKINSSLPEISAIKSMSARGSIAISYAEMPGFLSKTIVCVCDPDFFSHKGLLTSSLKTDAMKLYNGEKIENKDKTLTQNLAAIALNINESGSSDSTVFINRTVSYLKECLLALKIESKIKSKDKILEIYLNNAPFGEGVSGLLQASVVYFNKKPADLSEAECITLTAILKTQFKIKGEKSIESLSKEREKIIALITERGIVDRAKAEAYIFDDLKLNSYQSRINRFNETGVSIIKM